MLTAGRRLLIWTRRSCPETGSRVGRERMGRQEIKGDKRMLKVNDGRNAWNMDVCTPVGMYVVCPGCGGGTIPGLARDGASPGECRMGDCNACCALWMMRDMGARFPRTCTGYGRGLAACRAQNPGEQDVQSGVAHAAGRNVLAKADGQTDSVPGRTRTPKSRKRIVGLIGPDERIIWLDGDMDGMGGIRRHPDDNERADRPGMRIIRQEGRCSGTRGTDGRMRRRLRRGRRDSDLDVPGDADDGQDANGRHAEPGRMAHGQCEWEGRMRTETPFMMFRVKGGREDVGGHGGKDYVLSTW